MNYIAFGDSITTGTGASIPANGYISLLNAALSVTFNNQAVSTAMIPDRADQLYSRTTVSGDRSILMFGTNDQAKHDTDGSKRGYFIDGLRAMAVWLGSDQALTTPSTVTFSGSWSNGYAFSAYGSGVAGSKAIFTVTGTKFALGMIRQYNNTSTFRVRIDGIDQGIFSSGGDVRTILGRSYGPMCLAFSGLSSGSHTVGIEVISADSSNVVFFHWFSNLTAKASVYIANIPHALEYTYGGSVGNVDYYNHSIGLLVGELTAYGIDAKYVDVCSVLSPWDMNDNVHPNDSGHMKIKNAFYTAITGL